MEYATGNHDGELREQLWRCVGIEVPDSQAGEKDVPETRPWIIPVDATGVGPTGVDHELLQEQKSL